MHIQDGRRLLSVHPPRSMTESAIIKRKEEKEGKVESEAHDHNKRDREEYAAADEQPV